MQRFATAVLYFVLFIGMGFPLAKVTAAEVIRVIDRKDTEERPPTHEAFYTRSAGEELLGPAGLSADGGKTWKAFTPQPDFTAGLPHGYRREPFPAVADPKNNRLVLVYNALDTPGLDPKIIEPSVALESYYLRYRVSIDAGRTWLFDEPVIQEGHTEDHPFDGVWMGKNAIFFGDVGSVPLFTNDGALLAPVVVCPLDEDGKLYNPLKTTTFTDVVVVIGTPGENNRLKWQLSERVRADVSQSTRGMIEPALAQFRDGRILMVMRGSNANRKSKNRIPSYKWQSISKDGGRTWTKPVPWTMSGGKNFYSPSSMSQLMTHSSGRVFWIGNITPENPNGNSARWPLVMGEVDPETLELIESSLITLDTRRPDDPERIDISHFRAIEDRETGEIILTVPRALNKYKSQTWTEYRLEIVPKIASWKLITPNAAFSERDSCGEVVFKDRMWIMGGWYDSKTTQELRDVWNSADGVNWNRVTDNAAWTHPQHPVTLVFRDKMWMLGGYQGGRLPGAGQTSEVWSSEDGAYWVKATTAPWEPRFAAGGAVFDDKMWILGGSQFPRGAATDTAIAFNDVWSSADGENWTRVTEHAPWTARGYHRVLVHDKKLWLLGGGNYRTAQGKILVNNDVWSSVDGKHWTQVTEHAAWSPRIWHEAIVYQDAMWILGGGSSNKTRLLNDVWRSTDGVHWTEVKSDNIWSPRHEMSVYDFQGKLWVVGGAVPTKTGLANDVWNIQMNSQ